MALQSIPGGLWIPHPLGEISANPAFSAVFLLDAASEKAAVICRIPKTGNISKVRWRTNTVTTGATMDIRVETVDASGDPSGTLIHANASGTQVVVDTDDNTSFASSLAAAVAVTRGDLVAIIVAQPSASSGSLTVSAYAAHAGWISRYPYGNLFTTSWAKQTVLPCFGLEYDDGSYAFMPPLAPISATNNAVYNSGTVAADERGLKFKLPFPTRVTGCWAYMLSAATADYQILLYDSDGSTVMTNGTISHDGDHRQGTTGQGIQYFIFPGTIQLTKDTFYRLILKPTTTANVTLSDFEVGAAAVLDAFAGGQNFHYTDRVDAGSWTDTTTKRPMMGLIIDALDDGVSSGSTFPSQGIQHIGTGVCT